MRGLFIGSYPNPMAPYMSVFFRELVCAMADQGVECHVISPVSYTKYRKNIVNIPKERKDTTQRGNVVHVYHPRTMSFSAKKIGKWNTMALSQKCSEFTAIKACSSLNRKYDFVYGHFFLGGGLTAAAVGRKFGIPAFIAYGECSFETEVSNKYTIRPEHMEGIRGIIAVSSKNLNDLEQRSFADGIPKLLSINSINQNEFYVRDRNTCRRELGIPENDFVVGFVGYFIERKGSDRLLAACRDVDGVSLAFAGKGEDIPSGRNVVFCRSLNHEDVCTFLNAVDVFCLPTRNEGCCNAIIEAMACGKAIISSNLPFNRDILNEDNAILINPNSIDEIRNAVICLRDSKELMFRLSEQALADAQNLTISKRAENILKFISSFVQ